MRKKSHFWQLLLCYNSRFFLKMDDGMLNIPLFMVNYTEKLLNLRH